MFHLFVVIKAYRRALYELERIAVEERSFDANNISDDEAYQDGFLAGYRQALRDAHERFNHHFN